ncbi:MAG: hypothetical protein R6V75_06480 [Bacteroidales bacterium]
MKRSHFLIVYLILFFSWTGPVFSQGEPGGFPVDPYPVLKSWNYQNVRSTLGTGEQIVDTMHGQAYLAGYRYERRWLDRDGLLEFFFTPQGISRVQFRIAHPIPEPSEEVSRQLRQDTVLTKAYNLELARMDSLRRDSLVAGISQMMGVPSSAGPTPSADRQARYSANWFNHGYACTMRDLGNSTVMVFAIAKAPDWAVRQFSLAEEVEVISKQKVTQRRQSWTASLLGAPAEGSPMLYERVYLLLEFDTGQRYTESLPPLPYPARMVRLTYTDADGNAFNDPWVIVELSEGAGERHYIYSLQYREPIPVFDTDSQLPYELALRDKFVLDISFPDGTVLHQDLPRDERFGTFYSSGGLVREQLEIHPDGYHTLLEDGRNRDGSLNLAGTIPLVLSNGEVAGLIRISYRFSDGTWKPVKSDFL